MPFLPSSGALSINDIRNMFGGPSSPALSNYYRGGAYIPSQKTVNVTVSEPASGSYYSWNTSNNTAWAIDGGSDPSATSGSYQLIWWFSSLQSQGWTPSPTYLPNPGTVYSSYTIGPYTYYRGYVGFAGRDEYGYWSVFWSIYRTYLSSSTVNINTNVPSSGPISLSQFYGAEKP